MSEEKIGWEKIKLLMERYDFDSIENGINIYQDKGLEYKLDDKDKLILTLLLDMSSSLIYMNMLIEKLVEGGSTKRGADAVVYCPKCKQEVTPNGLGYCPRCKYDLSNFLAKGELHVAKSIKTG